MNNDDSDDVVLRRSFIGDDDNDSSATTTISLCLYTSISQSREEAIVTRSIKIDRLIASHYIKNLTVLSALEDQKIKTILIQMPKKNEFICDQSLEAVEAFLNLRMQRQETFNQNIDDDNLTLFLPKNSPRTHEDHKIMAEVDRTFVQRYTLEFVMLYLLPTANFFKIEILVILCVKYVVCFIKDCPDISSLVDLFTFKEDEEEITTTIHNNTTNAAAAAVVEEEEKEKKK